MQKSVRNEHDESYVGCVKVNVDGSCIPDTGIVACAGVARDHNGAVMECFMFLLAMEVVLWSILWDLKWEAKELIIAGWEGDHMEKNMLVQIQRALTSDNNVTVEWCSPEANKVADSMARAAFSCTERFQIFS